jgi:hypothetical protein
MRRFVAVLAGVAAGIAAAAALGRFEPPPEPARVRIVPDSGGRLSELLVHWDPAVGDAVLPTYRDLLAALPADVRVTVAVEQAEGFDDLVARLQAEGTTGLERLRPLVVRRKITIWSRDRFVTAELDGKPVLVVPGQTRTAVKERANDWVVPWTMAADGAFGVDALGASFAFDGGDIVADEDRIYATAVLPGRNGGTRWADRDALRAELAQRFDREALILGDSPDEVPDHHICMIVTPIGKGVVLVGDPALGRQVYETAGAPVLPGGVSPDFSPETLARFARVADGLRAAGLRVVPVPLVPTTTRFVFLSYDNVLLDDRADGRHVLLPQFGVEALDRAAREVWESEGFAVHGVDVSKLYVHGGALRCVAAVIRRGAPADSLVRIPPPRLPLRLCCSAALRELPYLRWYNRSITSR